MLREKQRWTGRLRPGEAGGRRVRALADVRQEVDREGAPGPETGLLPGRAAGSASPHVCTKKLRL